MIDVMIEKILTGDLDVNTYIYKYDDENAVIIDPGSDSDKIISRVDYLGFNVTGILLTHGHFDHVGAVKDVKEHYATKVYIHRDDATYLGPEGSQRHLEMFESMGPGSQRYFDMYYTENDKADVILTDGQILDEFGLTILHTPGHSPGSICLYSEENSILFSGDTLFKSGLGRTDFVGGDYETLIKSINRILKLPEDTVVYPGHGSYTTIKDEF